MEIRYLAQKQFPAEQLFALYDSVGWTAYTRDIPRLQAALERSTIVISAWEGDALVGLIRALSDETTIAYIQDILVRPTYHKQGVGSQLMRQMLSKLAGIRQIVLMTDLGDSNASLHDWYRSFGFKTFDALGTLGFAIFDY